MTKINIGNGITVEHDDARKAIPQGDCYLIPIKAVPAGMTRVAAEDGMLIITHSETGHHHVVMEREDVRQFAAMDVFQGFLEVGNEPADLVHLREHYTHATQVISPGAWLIQRQAAYTPQGWERARD
jgi:hypothetical protein